MKNKIFCLVMGIGLFVCFMVSAQADYYSVPAASFKGERHDEDYTINGNIIFKPSSPGGLYAPIHLPDGAIIEGFHLIYYNNVLGGSIPAHIVRSNMWNGFAENLFYVPGNKENYHIVWDSDWSSPYERKVNNARYNYYIDIFFSHGGLNQCVYGVRIQYKMPVS
jgi:hypothetical protein